MKHFGIYESVEDAQDALNAGRLENPYVALVDGDLDYNSLSPEELCYLGEWTDNGAGRYTLEVTDKQNSDWNDGLVIGQFLGVYFEGVQTDMDVNLAYNGIDTWRLEFSAEGGSDTPTILFGDGLMETLEMSDIVTDQDSSDAVIKINWNGSDTLVFYANVTAEETGLSMNTINPETECESQS